MDTNDKYVAICKWVEDGKDEWDVMTDIVSKDEALKATENVTWEGPNMNQGFFIVPESVYLEMLKLDENV
jgi:hypothetical protein